MNDITKIVCWPWVRGFHFPSSIDYCGMLIIDSTQETKCQKFVLWWYCTICSNVWIRNTTKQWYVELSNIKFSTSQSLFYSLHIYLEFISFAIIDQLTLLTLKLSRPPLPWTLQLYINVQNVYYYQVGIIIN